MQQAEDVGANAWCCCGAERHHRHAWAEIPQLPEASVIRTEVMPPGTDAVSFVHCESNQLTGCRLLLQQRTDRFPLQPFRCEIQKSEGSCIDLFEDATTLLELEDELPVGRVMHAVSVPGHDLRVGLGYLPEDFQALGSKLKLEDGAAVEVSGFA